MHLREDLSRKLQIEQADLEESLSMPYITSVERIAEERGEAQGEVKGGASVLLKQLTKLCGPVAGNLEERVRRLPLPELEACSALLESG